MRILRNIFRTAGTGERKGATHSGGVGPAREQVIAALQNDLLPNPAPHAMERGRAQLLSSLKLEPVGGTNRMNFAQFAFSPMAAALAGTVIIFGGIAGASAAAGGPDVTEPVRDAVGLHRDRNDVLDDDDAATPTPTPEASPEASPDDSPGATPDDNDDDGPGATPDDHGDDGPGATPDDHGDDGPGATPDDHGDDGPGATPDDHGDDGEEKPTHT